MKSLLRILSVVICYSNVILADVALEVTPYPLKFGCISVGGFQQRDLTMTNVGDQTLTLDSCQFQAPFTVGSVSGITLQPGESAIVTARSVWTLLKTSVREENAYSSAWRSFGEIWPRTSRTPMLESYDYPVITLPHYTRSGLEMSLASTSARTT